MRLADVVGHSGLAFYAEVALVLFAAVFVAIVWRASSSSRSAEYEAARRLPFEGGEPPEAGGPR